MIADSDEPSTIRSEIVEMEDGFRRVVHRSLIKWVIRTAIGLMLFGYLAYRYPWGKWILFCWTPIAVFSLYFTLSANQSILREARALHERLNEIESENDID